MSGWHVHWAPSKGSTLRSRLLCLWRWRHRPDATVVLPSSVIIRCQIENQDAYTAEQIEAVYDRVCDAFMTGWERYAPIGWDPGAFGRGGGAPEFNLCIISGTSDEEPEWEQSA